MFENITVYIKQTLEGGAITAPLQIGGGLLIAAFIAYLFFGDRDYRNPLWGFFVLMLSVLLFTVFIIAGYRFGVRIGLNNWGALIGVAAFIGASALYRAALVFRDKTFRDKKDKR